MFDTFTGLPLHILVVHFVVVLVPLALVTSVVMALSRTWRQRLAVPLLVLLTAAFGASLVAWQSGPELKARLNAGGETADAIARHQARGTLVPWFVAAALVLVLLWLLIERAQGQIHLFRDLPARPSDEVDLLAKGARAKEVPAGRRDPAGPGEEVRADTEDAAPAERRTDDLDGDGETTIDELVTFARRRTIRRTAMWVAVLACLAATFVVFLAGDSGSRAAWEPIVQNSAPR